MNANEIRTMKGEQVLIVHGNQDPIVIPYEAYYEMLRMKRAARMPPAAREVSGKRAMEWVEL